MMAVARRQSRSRARSRLPGSQRSGAYEALLAAESTPAATEVAANESARSLSASGRCRFHPFAGHVQAIPDVDQRDRQHQGREPALVVMTRRLVPHLVRNRVGAIAEARDRFP